MLSVILAVVLVIGPSTYARQDSGASSQGATGTATDSAQKPAQDQQNQTIPDAPSAVQPPPAIPNPPVTPGSAGQNPQSQPSQTPPPTQPSSQETAPPDETPAGPAPPLNVKTVPEGGATASANDTQEQFFKINVNVNQVIVPVTVTDESGRMVSGLLAKDFVVKENGKKQTLNFFTSDPFALSAAVILDLGMKDVDVQKVNHTFSALQGALSPFDEVSIYTYSNAVSQLSGWTAAGQKLSEALANLATMSGRNNGPQIVDGPLGPHGPMINNMPVDPSTPTVYTPAQESHVLNDAILRAALDLSKRSRDRRKIIFIISDGRESHSNASYRDVLKVLLSNNIMVYGIGVGGSAIPVYNKVQRIHLPRFGYSDILPKYASATGGEVSNELTRTGIEDAYSRLMGAARNQYTLGYVSHEPLVGQHNEIEILVDRPSCRRSSLRPCVDVIAREGYYAMPPLRNR